MVIRVSPVRENGSEHDYFLSRLARAQEGGRDEDGMRVNVSRDIPLDAMLRRGQSRRVLRHQSLSERDGDFN